MNTQVRHNLIKSTLVASAVTMDKQASASPEQAEILAAVWPTEGINKVAALAQILATGLMVEEAQASTA